MCLKCCTLFIILIYLHRVVFLIRKPIDKLVFPFFALACGYVFFNNLSHV